MRASIADYWPIFALLVVGAAAGIVATKVLARWGFTRAWRVVGSSLAAAGALAGLLATFQGRQITALAEHWPTLTVALVALLAISAVILVFRSPPRAAKALAAFLSAGCAALSALTAVAVYPPLYELLTGQDSSDPRDQSDIARLPVENGPLLVGQSSDAGPRVELIDIDEGTKVTVRPTQIMRDPSWSPGGAAFAFSKPEVRSSHIYRATLRQQSLEQLTHGPVDDSQPAWSPNGKQIAFARGQAGHRDIYLIAANGGAARPLTSGTPDDSSPTWSADGSEIAFARRTAGESDIYAVHMSTRAVSKLIDHSRADEDPAWSPDGSEIAFVSNRKGDFEIYRFIVGYQGRRTIIQRTKNSVDDRFPAWSPDGGEIAYLRGEKNDDLSLRVMNRQTERQDQEIHPGSLLASRPSWQPEPRKGWAFPSPVNLRRRHAPLVYLHPKERYLPLSAAAFIRRSSLVCGKNTLAPRADQDTLGHPPLAYSGRKPLSPAKARRFQCGELRRLDVEHSALRGKHGPAGGHFYSGVPLYTERNRYAGGLAFTYWFFYAFSVAGGRFGPHEGDWERVTICFTGAQTPRRMQPTAVVYHQHNGTEVRPWRWAPRFRTHPVVYVARGSHASYSTARRRVETQDITDENVNVWPTWWALRPIRDEPWYNFSGRWGGISGPSIKKGGASECPLAIKALSS